MKVVTPSQEYPSIALAAGPSKRLKAYATRNLSVGKRSALASSLFLSWKVKRFKSSLFPLNGGGSGIFSLLEITVGVGGEMAWGVEFGVFEERVAAASCSFNWACISSIFTCISRSIAILMLSR